MSGNMKKALSWLAGASLAVVAGALTVATPPQDALRAPFAAPSTYTPDAAAEPVTTRTLTAAVIDASFTERISVADAEWQADGNWLVITIAASAPRSEQDADLELATLRIGGETFHATERTRESLLGTRMRIGIDTVGMLAFELPADVRSDDVRSDDVRSGNAVLQLSPSILTPRLDDVITVTIPLGELPTASEIEITPPEAAS